MSVQTVKNKPVIIGLTGGIASGKSTVANILRKKGYKLIDSDFLVNNIWQNNHEVIQIVKSKYNINMQDKSGKNKLSDLIFSDEKVRKEINELIHPIVFKEIHDWINLNVSEDFLIIDMPLLFEVNYEKNVDFVILVYLDKDIQINRLISRNGINESEALKMINAQISLKDKKDMTKYVVDNNGSIDHLEDEVLRVLREIKNAS